MTWWIERVLDRLTGAITTWLIGIFLLRLRPIAIIEMGLGYDFVNTCNSCLLVSYYLFRRVFISSQLFADITSFLFTTAL